MDRLRSLLADAQAYLASASPREKRLIAFGTGGVALFLLLVVVLSFSAAIRKGQATLDEKRTDFDKISALSVGYAHEEQERQLLEARLRQSPPGLMSFVDGIARQEGVEVGGMSDRGVISGGQNGRPRESSVEVNLTKVPLDKLIKLLNSIEHSPGVVRVRRLRVSKNRENKDVLDVSLSVSAWQAS